VQFFNKIQFDLTEKAIIATRLSAGNGDEKRAGRFRTASNQRKKGWLDVSGEEVEQI